MAIRNRLLAILGVALTLLDQSEPSNEASNLNQHQLAEIDKPSSPLPNKCGIVPIFEKKYSKSVHLEDSSIKASTDGFRILHGLSARYGEWPWIVRITICEHHKDCKLCTGSLINSRWIITAGHCTIKGNVTYAATLGLYDLVVPDSGSFEMPIDRVIVHPNYTDLANDLSLMRLVRSVEFDDVIQPICLEDPVEDMINRTRSLDCFNVGYGLIEDMMSAVKLQKISVRVVPISECKTDLKEYWESEPNSLCIGPLEGRIGGSCFGDSGGPDQCYDPQLNRWFLIGTVSFGPPICDRDDGSKWLTASVDVSSYRSWIVATISNQD